MPVYFTSGEDLGNVADAIRAKLASTLSLEYPDGFVSAINDIPSGGITPTGTINITQNGTVDVTQYADANVAVPNSYSASDEGKVVSNGALVSQGSDTVTQNGTVDTTLISSLTVNVSGGGSSMVSGTFTPEENTKTATFNVGADATHFLVYATTNPYASDNIRKGSLIVLDWSTSNIIAYRLTSNGTGSSPGAYIDWSALPRDITISNGVITVYYGASGAQDFNYWMAGITYQWYAW